MFLFITFNWQIYEKYQIKSEKITLKYSKKDK
jgi:hypothetical protein